MKAIHASVSAAAILVAGAHAGETYVPAPAPEPAPTYSYGGWFAGGGVDYLFDAEEAYVNGHFGYEWGGGSSVFLEVGWTEADQDYYSPVIPTPLPFPTGNGGVGGGIGGGFIVPVGVDLIPVTANYKYEVPWGDSVSFYIGGGIGATYTDLSVGAFGDTDWSFTAQAFTGVVFNVSESFEIYTGLRYMWIDDSSLFGVNIDDLDDFGAGVGFRFNF